MAVVHGAGHWTRAYCATPHTAFDLGSCSKSFVATAIALLVSDGKLTFDTPVSQHLPEMQFDRDEVTRAATLRDLLSNRIGLKRQIPVESLANPEISALQVIRRVRHLDRLHPFRQGYVYFNPGFMACRLIVERVSGQPYGDFLQRRLFGPLGMTHSASGSDRAARLADRARGHTRVSGKAEPVDDIAFDNWQGAAGVWSCADDAVRWLEFLLDGGRVAGQSLLDPAALAQTHQPHTPMPRAECKLIHCPPEADAATCCMGWWTTTLHGRRVVQHAGEMFGWRAHTALVPDERIGVLVMLSAAVPRHAAIACTVLETLLTQESRDWCEVADRLTAGQNAATARALESAFPAGPGKPLPLELYAGTYAHPACGPVDVCVASGALEMQFRDGRLWQFRLEPLGGHVFTGRVCNPSVSDYVPVPIRARFDVVSGHATVLTDPQATYRRVASA